MVISFQQEYGRSFQISFVILSPFFNTVFFLASVIFVAAVFPIINLVMSFLIVSVRMRISSSLSLVICSTASPSMAC